MKAPIKILYILSICFISGSNAFAQETRQLDDSTFMYVKSCRKTSGDIQLCTLCKDKGLSKGCELYFYNGKAKQGTRIILSEAQAEALLANKPPSSISGLRTNRTGGVDYYSYSAGNSTTYIFTTGAGPVVTTLDDSGPATSHKNEQADPRITKFAECLKQIDASYKTCSEHADQIPNPDIRDDNLASCDAKYKSDAAECGRNSGFPPRLVQHIILLRAIRAAGSPTIHQVKH